MAEAQENDSWVDDLAEARDGEVDSGEEHPADPPAEAAAEPAAEPEAEAAAPEAEAEAGEERQVPLATFLDERNKLTAKIDILEQRLSQTTGNLDKLNGLQEQLEALREERAKKPAPDYLEDPKAYIDHSNEGVVQQLQAIGDQVKESQEVQGQTKQELENQQQTQNIMSAAGSAEAAFAEKTPDYWDALDYLRNVRRGQMKILAPEATPMQIDQAMRTEEFQTAAGMLTNGRNPAEYAYQYAKSVGYTGKKEEIPAKEAEDMADARENAQGLGNAGAALPQGDLENLMDMDNDEFDQALKEMFG